MSKCLSRHIDFESILRSKCKYSMNFKNYSVGASSKFLTKLKYYEWILEIIIPWPDIANIILNLIMGLELRDQMKDTLYYIRTPVPIHKLTCKWLFKMRLDVYTPEPHFIVRDTVVVPIRRTRRYKKLYDYQINRINDVLCSFERDEIRSMNGNLYMLNIMTHGGLSENIGDFYPKYKKHPWDNSHGLYQDFDIIYPKYKRNMKRKAYEFYWWMYFPIG